MTLFLHGDRKILWKLMVSIILIKEKELLRKSLTVYKYGGIL